MIATLAVAIAVLLISAFAIWWIARRWISRASRNAFLILLALPLCFSLFLVSYIFYYLGTPVRQASCLSEEEGIVLSRLVESGDEPKHIAIAKVDLQKFAIGISPPDLSDRQLRFPAMTTSDALRKYGGVLAVNASVFRPFRGKHLFDHYPHRGDLVEAIGRTVFESVEISAPNSWPMLWIAEGKLRISEAEAPAGVLASTRPEMAVSGKSLLLKDGVVAVARSDGKRYPRTSVGLDATGNYLWLVVVDGKQPAHSEGIDLQELAELMADMGDMGVADAIELDGGGSSTMVAACKGKIEVINRPSHTNMPARERPVANYLIVRSR